MTTMDEFFKRSNMQFPIVEISSTKHNGKWTVRVKGVTSGFVVHTESDNSTIEFQFDAERFEPIIRLS